MNRWPIWRRRVRVWDCEATAISFDRLLNLWLHRLGWMGESTRAYFEESIRPGMTVVDVGANQGLYALLFSRLTGAPGRVYAFEPDPDLYRAAVANCKANHAVNVTLFPLALGSKESRLTLWRSLVNAGDNRLAPGSPNPSRQPVEVPVKPLDTVLAGASIDFMKIDVQGWEWEVIQGMQGVLEQPRGLTIWLEFWPEGLRAAGADPVRLLQFLSQRGFRIHATGAAELQPVTDFESLTRRYPGARYTDLAAIR
ncbi:MAG TPA: FkbM family methyltransferase [Bryobacteraceae bacterium]|nr:FkbM family methyltransferase [Bryobacteraceae bacterium]